MKTKKILAFVMAVAATFVCSASAFAANGEIVYSPSHHGPEADTSTSGSATAGTTTPSTSTKDDEQGSTAANTEEHDKYKAYGYSKRSALTAKQKREFTKCYNDVKKHTDLTELTEDIADIAEEQGLDVSDLAVSDIFYSVLPKDKKSGTRVRVKAPNLDKFVALLCYSNGQWSVVKDAKINANGKLVFKTKKAAAYAIVIDTTEEDAE